jgi:hypothetical protein
MNQPTRDLKMQEEGAELVIHQNCHRAVDKKVLFCGKIKFNGQFITYSTW